MSGYIGPLPVPQGIQRKQSFTATASQTTFNTNGYTDGDFINVYLNGVRLINGTDYTATNGSDIVLTTGASASDVLDFETFQTFQLVDQQFENVTLKNPTHEDTDGGRESTLIFKGEQSGGEISTLAQIQASHDGTSDDQKGDLIFKTNDGSDNDAPTERMRIDSAGNVGIATTENVSLTSSEEGFWYDADDWLAVARSAGTVAYFNRLSTDGDIAEFRKDGTSVGSIGSQGGDSLTIGNGDTGLLISAANDVIHPWNTSTNAARDNAIDLGRSTHRFKDLYLSGGAYIGGTVAANYLDDYEEGTWTPSTSVNGFTQTISSYQDADYTKIGSLVFARCTINLSSSGYANAYGHITGLPFSSDHVYGSGRFVSGSIGAGGNGGAVYVTGTQIYLFETFGTTTSDGWSTQWYLSFTYRTAS